MLSINPRVQKTAVLDIVGSKSDRKLIAKRLHDKFDRQVFKILDKKGEISSSQIEEIVNKLCPNVRFSIEKCMTSYMAGFLSPKSDFITNGVKGHNLALNLKHKNKKIVIDYNVLEHEMTHFFDSVTNPKFQVDFSNKTEGDEQANSLIFDIVMGFYNKHLYSLVDTPQKQKLPLNKRVDDIRSKLTKFFEKNGYEGTQKIEVLQQWRYYLLTEINAFRQGAIRGNRLLKKLFVESVKDKVEGSSKKINLEKQLERIKNMFNAKTREELRCNKEDFLFEYKLKLIEQMIKDERKKRVESRVNA